jgi:ArsR family transcriptional regulator, arsenate/arsenite/antimonite-responsive transcriptional repressor
MENKILDTISPELSTSEQVEIAKLARALGHPHRIAILQFLLDQQSCFCGRIVDVLPIAQSTVSQHLKKLKDAGWIKGEIEGPRVCYCIKHDTLTRFQGLFTVLLESTTES